MRIITGILTLTLLTTLAHSAPATPPPGASAVVSLESSALSASGSLGHSSPSVDSSPVLPIPSTAIDTPASGVDSIVTSGPPDITVIDAPDTALKADSTSTSGSSVITGSGIMPDKRPGSRDKTSKTPASVPSSDDSGSSSNTDRVSGPKEKAISAVGDALRDSVRRQMGAKVQEPQPVRNVIHFPVALEVDLVPDEENVVNPRKLAPL